jgi:outer membrane protein
LRKNKERIEIREEQIRQAEGKLALARVKFNHGMANNFDVIEAETELQRSRVDLLSVKTDYIVGTYNMRAVLGTLVDR